jgi:hypothetical protein
MRVTWLVALAAVILVACGTTGLQGRIEGGRYYAPNGMVSFVPPNMRGPQHSARDLYVGELDRGFLEETDAFGLQGVYYSTLPQAGITPPSGTEERRAALNTGLARFAMQVVFDAGSTRAEVVEQEFIGEQGNEMLLALVRLPGLSGSFDVRTGRKFDAFPAVLVVIEGGYLVILRVQSNIVDAEKKDTSEKMSGYLAGLRKLRSGLEVRL